MKNISLRLYIKLSSAINKLSRQGLEAIWAEKVFNTLASQHIINDVKVPLMDYLASLTHPPIEQHWGNTTHEISSAKGQIMESIDIKKGVEIPQSILNTQERFGGAVNSNGKVTFYPNHFVTPKIFHSLFLASRANKLMTVGKPGISKSMNYIQIIYMLGTYHQ